MGARIRLGAWVAAVAVAPLAAQGDGALFAELSMAGPTAAFHLGEPIVLQLSFFGPPDRFNVNTTVTKTPLPDEVMLTPETGFSKLYPESYRPDYGSMAPIGDKPVSIPLTLNEWFRFEKTGRYTVWIKTPRVTPRNRSSLFSRDSVLTTNSVTFEIVPMNPEQEAREVARLGGNIEGTPDQNQR